MMDEQGLREDAAAALSRQVEASMRAAMASADKPNPEAESAWRAAVQGGYSEVAYDDEDCAVEMPLREQLANLERRVARIEELQQRTDKEGA